MEWAVVILIWVAAAITYRLGKSVGALEEREKFLRIQRAARRAYDRQDGGARRKVP